MRLRKLLPFCLIILLSNAAFSQDQTLEKAVIISGGESEFAGPFDDFASIGYYNANNQTYAFQDSIYTQSVQNGFIEGNSITFGAQDSIIQYNIENQEREKQFLFPQISFIASGEGRLAAGNFSLGRNPDFPFVAFFDTANFSPLDTLTNDSLQGGEDAAFYNDKAYVGFNITKANSRMDSIGRLARYNLSSGQREANIDLGQQGAGVSKVFVYNNKVHAVCERQGQLATIDPGSGNVSFQPLGITSPFQAIIGPLNDRIYAVNNNYQVVYFDLQSGTTNATGIMIEQANLGQFGGINAFNYDTINQQVYVGLTDFSDTGYVEVYDQSGKIDSFETNISTANILLDYDDFTPDGGTVTTATGADTAYACIDGQADMISFDSSTTAGGKYRYVITDRNENILQVKQKDQQNFEPAGTGICYVYGISYSGNLQNTSNGTPLSDLTATSSFSRSSNRITVIRDTLDGGRVEVASTGNDTARVTINNQPSEVQFSNTSETEDLNYTYVITNSQDTILNGDAGNSQNFNGAGVGTCYVYGFAHAGALNATPDSSIASVTADQCIEQSANRITVIRESDSAVGIANEDDFRTRARVFPNPAQNRVTVELQTARSGEASIEVRNISGKLIRLQETNLKRGFNQVRFSLNEASQGLYLVAIQHNDKRYTTKLLLK